MQPQKDFVFGAIIKLVEKKWYEGAKKLQEILKKAQPKTVTETESLTKTLYIQLVQSQWIW